MNTNRCREVVGAADGGTKSVYHSVVISQMEVQVNATGELLLRCVKSIL